MSDKEKAKRFVELHSGKVVSANGSVASAEFDTEQEATIFMEELERLRVCCGPESDFKIVRFQENHLGEVLTVEL